MSTSSGSTSFSKYASAENENLDEKNNVNIGGEDLKKKRNTVVSSDAAADLVVEDENGTATVKRKRNTVVSQSDAAAAEYDLVVEDEDDTATMKRKRNTVVSQSDAAVADLVVEDEDGTATMKKKKKERKHFERIWTEDDEISIIKTMLHKGGNIPKLYELSNKSNNVSRGQLKDKVRKLKAKFHKYDGRRGKNGEDPTFSKPHDKRLFQLSKQLWGGATSNGNNKSIGDNDDDDQVKANEKPMKTFVVPSFNFKPSLDILNTQLSTFEQSLLKKQLDSMESSKRKELEDKEKELLVAELTVYIERLNLTMKLFKVLLDAIKKRSDSIS